MKKALLIAISVIAVLILLAQIDDNLSDEAIGFIDRMVEGEVSESYLYLNGIFSSADEDPIEVGKNLLEENKRLEEGSSSDIAEYPEAKKLTLPNGALFCRVWEDPCIETLFSSEANHENLLAKHQLLIGRSNTFLEFKDFNSPYQSSNHAIFPPYQYIAAAERIQLLNAISIYRSGKSKEAVELLLARFSKLRKSFEIQDNLIGKLVFLMKLSDIVDITSVMLSADEGKVKSIPNLSQAEKDFQMVATYEFGFSYLTFKNLDRNPEFFGMGGHFPGWLTRIVFKPNMTINSGTPTYSRMVRLAQMSPEKFAAEIESGDKFSPPISKLRNYVGGVLFAISPGYDEYVARFQDFDAKIALFNRLHSSDPRSDQIGNPYYDGEEPTESDGALCFRGPMKDERFMRCLRVEI